jgi:large subunit ribosomal protein L7/L12
MSLSKEDIISAIAEMSVKDVVELISAMEEKFGVSAAAAVMAGPASGSAAAAVEEKTEFTVVLANSGEKKVNVIKVVRELTGLGLKEAKALVDGAPSTVQDGVAKKVADESKAKLEEAGATVEIK